MNKNSECILATRIHDWWKENKRIFPWRNTSDPYSILISEVLLHRTRASQVMPIYLEFIKKYPTVKALSNASLNDVKDMLHPLGLHWRATYLYQMGSDLELKFNGKVPSQKDVLESLPGIGDYIASAVRCFAFNYPDIILDTNTIRILGRVFGIKITDGSRRSKKFIELYQQIIDCERPREFNYGMIDLGALICKPKKPHCEICPIKDTCKYRAAKEKVGN